MALALRSKQPAASSSSFQPISSSGGNTNFKYDVFLSFRGKDTRDNFTDHLYTALKQAGIWTFRDDDEMERGRLLKPELETAIQQSEISIIVFSQNYASSRWCLDEVLKIIEQRNKPCSKHEVVPVFYKVTPSDVGNQKGSFAEDFNRHYQQVEAEMDDECKKDRLEKVKAWRAALKEAADLTGMVFTNGSEANFIVEVVSMIKKKLRRDAIDVAGLIVGINDRIYWIDSWIKNGSSYILVLYGIGGVGKTTTAKCIYNSICHMFEGSCFLEDVREMFKQSKGVWRLQSQLVSTILRKQEKEVIWNARDGANKVKHAIANRDVLIVLDDVTEQTQFEELLGTSKFSPGSKLIITTRNMDLLYALEGDCQGFPIKELDDEQSMELFSWHAFGQRHPREAYKEKAKDIVRHCGGLPLALKVIGSSLKGRNIAVWEDSLSKLEAIPDSSIQETLKLSYKSLEDNERELFLHIACFFVREDKDDVIRILEQCGLFAVVGIDNLINRCLLGTEQNILLMHELIQNMGKEIIRQESPLELGKRSRLCQNEDSFNVLKEMNGTEKIKGLSIDMKMLIKSRSIQPTSDVDDIGGGWYKKIFSKSNMTKSIMSSSGRREEDLKISAFKMMENLLLLRLNYATLSGSYHKLPQKLRWLCWHGFPSKSIPIEIPFDMLISLDISYSKLRRVWKGLKFLRSLKILNLSYSEELEETPNFGGLPCLQKLILKGCLSLIKICESITQLKGLVYLDLQGCGSLQTIPCLPTSLVTLNMSDIINLVAVGRGKWWGPLPQKLVNLDVRSCNLTCDSFPPDFSHLVSLECLDISNNPFTELPQCIQSLPKIQDLKVHDCGRLQSLLGLPSTLKSLDAAGNYLLAEVSTVPNTITFLNYVGSENLAVVRGYFKSAKAKYVDEKIKRYMGLASISFMERGLEIVGRADTYVGSGRPSAFTNDDPIEVWYEFGIFSISVPGQDLPNDYMFKEMGSRLVFKVPSVPNKPKVQGLNVCFICRSDITLPYHWTSPRVHVYNKTKDILWVYIPTLASLKLFGKEGDKINFLWLSLWKCGELLEEEDEVIISVTIVLSALGKPATYLKCDECCVNLVYEDMILDENNIIEAAEGEMPQQERTYQLSWTDKVLVEVSDFVHRGKQYYFSSFTIAHSEYGENVYLNEDIEFVDWLGPRRRSSSRYFNGGLIQHIKFTD